MTQLETLAHRNDYETLNGRALESVRNLDPELLERDDTRMLVEMGIQLINDITDQYGSPEDPRWHTGTIATKLQTYHNGGEDGHTSISELGVGVPRSALLVMDAVNRAAGHEVYNPLDRATVFYAACAHDLVQNCDRTLLEEGQGEDRGDERLSADEAVRRLFVYGGDDFEQIGPAVSQGVRDAIMATAFNPNTSSQNIDYVTYDTNPDNPALQKKILYQEAIAAADLLHITSPRGVVGSMEFVVENLTAKYPDLLVPHTSPETSSIPMQIVMDKVSESEALRGEFTEVISKEHEFVEGFSFSDRAIRQFTGGKGIDDLFPGRLDNAARLIAYSEKLRSGESSPRQVWELAKLESILG